ncbi:MAG: 50S ribosomal protein L22 [Actinomycetota bacterium]|nr:50S ribosomal protein L22 [Actinomycetota bacterium]MDA3006500.1 50S ribosomal protein L22 [Actinomycetota bacterium]MDA3034626.1 50S ribosomal protein L22 [Actinomycetota bacterium]
MTGPKTNEGATAVGERTGTKAVARHIRSSAFKARPVLDLIRGLDVRRADEVLMLTERGIARDIRKVLRSAVANAVNNDGQDVDELFVVACFADEGSTLKRFRPRARGRATRIRKRTCHITVIVARMSDERLEILRAKAEGASTSASAARRARVEASRQRAEAAKAAIDAADDDEAITDEAIADDVAADEIAADATEADAVEADAADDGDAADESDAAADEVDAAGTDDGTKADETDETEKN